MNSETINPRPKTVGRSSNALKRQRSQAPHKKFYFGVNRYENYEVFAGYYVDPTLTLALGLWVGKDNSQYTGEFQQGKLHGNGKLIQNDGSLYIGSFHANKKFGVGRITNKDSTFLGEFSHDERNGYGVSTFSGTTEIKGSFKNGKLTNFGVLKIKNPQSESPDLDLEYSYRYFP